MKSIFSIGALSAFLLSGCVSYSASTPQEVRAIDSKHVTDFTHKVNVPAEIAYRNILEKARNCWTSMHRIVESDPYDISTGYARVSLRIPGSFGMDSVIKELIQIYPEGEKTSRIEGRTLNSIATNKADMENLNLWAEGKPVKCQ